MIIVNKISNLDYTFLYFLYLIYATIVIPTILNKVITNILFDMPVLGNCFSLVAIVVSVFCIVILLSVCCFSLSLFPLATVIFCSAVFVIFPSVYVIITF